MADYTNSNYNNELILKMNLDQFNHSKVTEYIFGKTIENINSNEIDMHFNCDGIISELEKSKTTVQNKLNSLTGLSARELISSLRINWAKQLLTNNLYNISEIAYKVGFNDPKYFSRCFKNLSGINPKKYRESVLRKKETGIYTESDSEFTAKAIAMIEKRIVNQNYCINEFASDLCVSKSSLYRRLKDNTGLSPVEFIRSVRIKHSKNLFEKFTSIQEVAYAVGFNDTKYFSRCFKKEIGLTPKEYKTLISNRDLQ